MARDGAAIFTTMTDKTEVLFSGQTFRRVSKKPTEKIKKRTITLLIPFILSALLVLIVEQLPNKNLFIQTKDIIVNI